MWVWWLSLFIVYFYERPWTVSTVVVCIETCVAFIAQDENVFFLFSERKLVCRTWFIYQTRNREHKNSLSFQPIDYIATASRLICCAVYIISEYFNNDSENPALVIYATFNIFLTTAKKRPSGRRKFFEAERKVNTTNRIQNPTNAHNQMRFIVSFHEVNAICFFFFFC